MERRAINEEYCGMDVILGRSVCRLSSSEAGDDVMLSATSSRHKAFS